MQVCFIHQTGGITVNANCGKKALGVRHAERSGNCGKHLRDIHGHAYLLCSFNGMPIPRNFHDDYTAIELIQIAVPNTGYRVSDTIKYL